MIYVGIVGARSPLGLKVIDFLSKNSDKYRIAFYVDKSYRVSSMSEATYAGVEAALSFNQAPTVVIDCDSPDGALDRAKTYRFYAVPAIMCCACSPDELDTVSRVFGAEEVPTPSLVTAPDFSICNTRLMAFFLRMGARHIDDIDRLEIAVHLPVGKKLNIGIWVTWAQIFNAIYGTDCAKINVKGNTCYCGKVIINSVSDSASQPNGEEVHIRLFYGKKTQLCYTYMKAACDDLVCDCLEGVKKLLDWFEANPDEIGAGKVFANHLSTVMFAGRKNLL